MEPIKYSCLGCAHCFPAVATNALGQAFPEAALAQPGCAFEARTGVWPPVPGEYFASCNGQRCPVAVSTLASMEIAERLNKVRPRELCIVGKTETENIGVDKLIKNVITNPTIRFLVVAGREPEGHFSGKTLLALGENGVDEKMRVVGSPGKRPILRNVTLEEIEAFRRQVEVVDMVGCEDVDAIIVKLKELSTEAGPSCGCGECTSGRQAVQPSAVPIVHAEAPTRVEMTKRATSL